MTQQVQGTATERDKSKLESSRQLQKQYRNFNHDIKTKGDDLADPNSDNLLNAVRNLNALGSKIVRPSEQADDSECFQNIAQRGAEMAKRVAAGKGKTPTDFLRHLKAIYVDGSNAQDDGEKNPHAFNWNKLGTRVARYFYYAPGASCMLGPLDQAPKQKKVTTTQRLAKKPIGKAIAPEVMTAEDPDAKEKRETERNMETMWQVLQHRQEGVPFLHLVMNHRSFAQLAENCFTLAFLVNAKRVRMARSEPNNERGILVFPRGRKNNSADTDTTEAKDRSQFVLSYSTQDWKEWKKYVAPEDCLMPHRTEHEDEMVQQVTQMQHDSPPTQAGPSRQDVEDEGEDASPEDDSAKKRKRAGPQSSSRMKQLKDRHRLHKSSH